MQKLCLVEQQKFVILTGLSGAGKSLAVKSLEDEGFFCVDNLPPALIPKFAELCASSSVNRLAMVIDVRGRSFFHELQEALNQLPPTGFEPKIIFFEASEAVLVRRFSETRRRHPLTAQGGVLQAIQQEARELAGLRGMATKILDTTNLTPSQLQGLLRETLELEASPGKVQVHVLSFGFKHGLPPDADLVFDVRFIANPYYVPELRRLTGLDAPVAKFVLERADAKEFLERVEGLLQFLLPKYQLEGKHQVTLAIGCTGGQHRSTAIADRISRDLRRSGYSITVQHRDLEREQQRVAAI
ncbi:RNase adapter RapZ [bacterium]|nr:RNase adapter RapZ [bacterium]